MAVTRLLSSALDERPEALVVRGLCGLEVAQMKIVEVRASKFGEVPREYLEHCNLYAYVSAVGMPLALGASKRECKRPAIGRFVHSDSCIEVCQRGGTAPGCSPVAAMASGSGASDLATGKAMSRWPLSPAPSDELNVVRTLSSQGRRETRWLANHHDDGHAG